MGAITEAAAVPRAVVGIGGFAVADVDVGFEFLYGRVGVRGGQARANREEGNGHECRCQEKQSFHVAGFC